MKTKIKTITLSQDRENKLWVARINGSKTVIPTPFKHTTSSHEVVSQLQQLNPGSVITTVISLTY